MNTTNNGEGQRTGPRVRLEVAALCIGNAVSFAGAGAIPFWVAALIRAGRLSTIQVSWLASGELASLAISVLASSAWGRQSSPRRIAATAAFVVVASNALAMLHAIEAIVIGRLLSGVAMGALLATVTKVAARRQDAQRVLALMQAAMVLLMSVVYFIAPTLISRFGLAGLFAVLAVVGALAVLVSATGLPAAVTGAATDAKQLARVPKLAPLLGCLALAVVFMGQGSVWIYIILIGSGLGIDGRTLGVVLAIVPPLGMLGPLSAHALGVRVGLLWPLLFGLALLGVDFFLLVLAPSAIFFCIYAAILNLSLLFSAPFAIALLGRLDASGRFAAMAPAFMMIGGAVSPTLGSKVLAMGGFYALAFVAASCVATSIVLFSTAAGIGGYQNATLRVSGRPTGPK